MTLGDSFRTALANLAGHRLRSVLTMLGLIFGVGAVIAMLAIGAGAERQALEMISRLGERNVLVRDLQLTDKELEEAREKSPGLSRRDAIAILDALPGIETMAERATIDPYSVRSGSRTVDATVHGVSASLTRLGSLEIVEGRLLDQLDEQSHGQVCLIGEGVRRELFGYEPVLGKDLQVNDLWLEVVGVLEGTGGARTVQGVTIGSTDQEIYIPITTALRKLARSPLKAPLDEIVLRLDGAIAPREAARLISILLDRLHGGVEDFEIVVPDLLIEQSRRTQRLFSLVMGCIAGISLLVGGIGIMNIMLASVLERTREIGIRRAAGARRQDIGGLFLIEGLVISLLGGLAGIVAGTVMARVVAASAAWPTVITPISVVLSFSVAVAVGLVSGIYPALRAADLNPIDALRYE